MANTMQVSLVAADREVWSGEATVVNARTLAGEIGIMANHQPIMSVLASGQVDVRTCKTAPQLGERVTVIPNHICPCVNLQDAVWWRDEDGTLVELNIDARGRLS